MLRRSSYFRFCSSLFLFWPFSFIFIHFIFFLIDTLCSELDQERKARYAIQQKLKGNFTWSKEGHKHVILFLQTQICKCYFLWNISYKSEWDLVTLVHTCTLKAPLVTLIVPLQHRGKRCGSPQFLFSACLPRCVTNPPCSTARKESFIYIFLFTFWI